MRPIEPRSRLSPSPSYPSRLTVKRPGRRCKKRRATNRAAFGIGSKELRAAPVRVRRRPLAICEGYHLRSPRSLPTPTSCTPLGTHNHPLHPFRAGLSGVCARLGVQPLGGITASDTHVAVTCSVRLGVPAERPDAQKPKFSWVGCLHTPEKTHFGVENGTIREPSCNPFGVVFGLKWPLYVGAMEPSMQPCRYVKGTIMQPCGCGQGNFRQAAEQTPKRAGSSEERRRGHSSPGSGSASPMEDQAAQYLHRPKRRRRVTPVGDEAQEVEPCALVLRQGARVGRRRPAHRRHLPKMARSALRDRFVRRGSA